MTKKSTQLQSAYENLTDEMVQQRWLKLRPTLLKGLALFSTLAIIGYLLFHIALLPANFNRYLGLGAAFCLTLSGCLLFMTIMAFIFGKPLKQARGGA